MHDSVALNSYVSISNSFSLSGVLIMSLGTKLNKLSHHLSYFSELLHHLLDLHVTILLLEGINSTDFSSTVCL